MKRHKYGVRGSLTLFCLSRRLESGYSFCETRFGSLEASHQRVCNPGRSPLSITSAYRDARILGEQLLRSSTSVGANYRAACRARSRAEFASKLGIVLEEADEAVFWLELNQELAFFPKAKLDALIKEANELVSIFVSSVRTTKGFTSAI